MLNICYHSRLNCQHNWEWIWVYLYDLLMSCCQWTLINHNNSKLASKLLGLIMASLNTFLDTHKIDVHNSLFILIGRPCLSGMWLAKNKHPKITCPKEIGLHAQKVLTIPRSIRGPTWPLKEHKNLHQCLGRTLGIINQNPSVSKSNQLHIMILQFFFINLKGIA